MTHVVAIIPAKNSVDSVAATVTALIETGAVGEVLVVDDGSVDGTGESAAKAGARVVGLDSNIGKGGAVAAGIASSGAPDSYLLVDADLGASAGHAIKLLEPLKEDAADMTIAVFPSAGRSRGFGFAKLAATELLMEATGRRFAEPLSGQRAVNGALMRSLTLAEGFGLEVGLTIDTNMLGKRILEVPVDLSHSPTGRGVQDMLHRARQFGDLTQASASRLGWRRTLASILRSLIRRFKS
ncbi:MAG: glycosyltransferase [Acidimicrobiales bacterium]|nr:glycosyltransferase [Acidimicrobiales bacterium]|tara:strand:+ start:2437 stop:3156 length:720 start_codon:yes stop_codon:yes gene_type:complete